MCRRDTGLVELCVLHQLFPFSAILEHSLIINNTTGGGCGIPLLPADPTGIDCTAIPGVHDVSCMASRCVVERCKNGFQVSSDRTTCVPTTRTSPNTPVFVNNGGGPFKARDA